MLATKNRLSATIALVTSLLIMPPATLAQETTELMPAMVESSLSAKALMKRTAKYYARHYAKNMVLKYYYLRTVSANDGYVQLCCDSGVWGKFNYKFNFNGLAWDDPSSQGGFLNTESFNSLPRIPGTTSDNPVFRVTSSTESSTNQFKINYTIIHDYGLMDNKRAFELYSPLNAKQIGNFDLEIVAKDDVDGETTYTLAFSDRSGVFPTKTRLHAKGYLTVTEEGRPICLKSSDYEDRFSLFVRNYGILARATEASLEIKFEETCGNLYAKSVERTVTWKPLQDIKDGQAAYYHEHNAYRNPSAHGMSSHTVIVFHDPLFFDADDAKEEVHWLPSIGQGTGESPAWLPEIDDRYIHACLSKLPDKEKIVIDLESIGMPLEEQAHTYNERYLEYIVGLASFGITESKLRKDAERNKMVYEHFYGENR